MSDVEAQMAELMKLGASLTYVTDDEIVTGVYELGMCGGLPIIVTYFGTIAVDPSGQKWLLPEAARSEYAETAIEKARVLGRLPRDLAGKLGGSGGAARAAVDSGAHFAPFSRIFPDAYAGWAGEVVDFDQPEEMFAAIAAGRVAPPVPFGAQALAASNPQLAGALDAVCASFVDLSRAGIDLTAYQLARDVEEEVPPEDETEEESGADDEDVVDDDGLPT